MLIFQGVEINSSYLWLEEFNVPHSKSPCRYLQMLCAFFSLQFLAGWKWYKRKRGESIDISTVNIKINRIDKVKWKSVILKFYKNWVVVSNICYFHPENWGRFPVWLIFFKGVETTNCLNFLFLLLSVDKKKVGFSICTSHVCVSF